MLMIMLKKSFQSYEVKLMKNKEDFRIHDSKEGDVLERIPMEAVKTESDLPWPECYVLLDKYIYETSQKELMIANGGHDPNNFHRAVAIPVEEARELWVMKQLFSGDWLKHPAMNTMLDVKNIAKENAKLKERIKELEDE